MISIPDKMEFYQIKIVVDDTLVRMTPRLNEGGGITEDDERVRHRTSHFNRRRLKK